MITDIALHSASTGQQIATVAIGTGSKRYFQLMKHDYVELKFSSYQPFRVNIGDWIMLDSIGRYEVTKPFDPAANSSGEYGYELQLNAQYWKFANKLMKFMPQIGGKETSWTYTGTIADHANMVLCNLRALAFKRTTAGTEQFIPGREGFCPGGDKDVAWEVVWDETVDATKAVTVKFDSTNIIDGIGMIATELNCEWWFVNNTLHFGRCLVGDDNPVQLEKDKEFATLDGRETNENYATRIFAYGSTRNLASTYRKELVFEVTQASGRDIVDGTRPLRPEWFNKTAIQTEATVLKKTVARPGLTVPLRVNGMTHTKSTQIADFTLDSLPAGSYAITNSASGAFRVGVTIKDYSGNHSDPTAAPEWSGLTSEVWIAVAGKMGVNNTQWDFNTHKTDSPQRNLDWERPTYFALTDNGEYATGFDLPLELHDVHIAVLIRNRNVAYEDDSYNVNSFVDITSQGELEVVCKTPAKKIEGLTVKVLDNSGAVSRTIAGVTLNPDFDTDETEASTLRLPSGDSLAVGTKFQLPDLRRNLVPASYFTSIYAAYEKYNDITINGIVTPRLMLPLHDENGVAINGYIDACPFTSEEEAIEDVVVFEDVYPSRVSTITELWRSEEYADETEEQDGSVTTETWRAFVYQDDLFNEGNPFDADAYMINGETLRITFQSGMLNGQTFEVRYIAESCGFEIIRDNDTLLPNDVVCPKIGDKFILHGFNIAMLSDEATDYVDLAEQDLLAKTREYIKNLNLDPSAYRIPLACDFAQEHCADIPGAACFPIGQSVNIVYPEYFENGRKSRVIGFEIPLDIPYDNPIYIIGEKPQFSRIGAIEDKLNNELKIAGSVVASSSSGGSSSGAYIIKRNDTTPASDANLFSAARAKVEFALKTAVQRITYLWKFIRGAEFGEYVEGQTGGKMDAEGNAEVKNLRVRGKAISNAAFEVGEFLAGVSGGFFGIDQNGDSYLEVARLYARVRAVFEELTVVKTGVLAGKQYITPGGGIVCTKVEEVTNASGTLTGWRCYFLSEQDGEKTECKFRANDQAISAVFNAATGTANKVSNHRYWRLVTAVDNDAYTDDSGNHYGYIELSATDCEAGSDTPQAGDEICQFGYRGTDEPRRQTAMVFSTVDADAPSIKLFRGINSYSLEGKAVVQFGVDAQSGKVFFRLGASDATHFLDYTEAGGLQVAGKISTLSTLDDTNTTLGTAINSKVEDTDVLWRLHTSQTDAPALPVLGSDGTITDLKGWQTDAPAVVPGQFVWTTTYVRYGNGTAKFDGTACVTGRDGKDAVTMTSEKVEYAIGTSGTVAPTSGWSTTIPAIPKGQYQWTRVTTTYSDGTPTVSYSVSYIPKDGEDGENGANYTQNLLLNSAFLQGLDKWTGWSTPPVREVVDINGKKWLHVKTNTGNFQGVFQKVATSGQSGVYTFSALVRGAAAGQQFSIGILFINSSGQIGGQAWNNWTVGTDTQHVSWQCTIPAYAVELSVMVGRADAVLSEIYYTDLKLEVGANPNPVWSPAPSEQLGVTIASESVTYAKNTTGIQPPDASFTATAIGQLGTISGGDYIWSKTEVTYTDGTVLKSYAVSRIGSDGETQIAGLHIAYATGITGSLPHPTAVTGFSTTMTAGVVYKYIGIRKDNSTADSTNFADYDWAEFRGSDGQNGASYSNNMLVGTKDWSGATPKGATNAGTISADKYNGFSVLEATGRWFGRYWIIDVEAGKDYTISCMVLGAPDNLSLMLNPSWGSSMFTSTFTQIKYEKRFSANQWGVAVKQIHCTKSGTLLVDFETSDKGSLVKWCAPKVEEGLNDTPTWSPHPSEMVATPAKLVIVNAPQLVFTYENNFATIVGVQQIVLQSTQQGTTGRQWSYRPGGASGFTDYPNATSETFTVPHNHTTYFPSGAKSCTFRCTSGDVYDEVTIYKVSSGSNGVDGANYTENLVADSGTAITTSGYLIKDFHTTEDLVEGGKYTLSIWGELAAGKVFNVYDNKGSMFVCQPKLKADGLYTTQFTWKKSANATNASFHVYNFPSSVSGTSTINKIKLEHDYNDNPVWTPAPADGDGITVILTNESHVFEGDTEKAVAGSTECGVIAYKGATQVAATIGPITGAPAGMSVSKQNDGTTSAKFTVAVAAGMAAKPGTLTIPVTVEGKTFTKIFSWSVSLEGTDGANFSENLLADAEFRGMAATEKVARWYKYTNVSVNNTHTMEGRNSIRSAQTGLTAPAWRGISQNYSKDVKPGDVFTCSIWVYCEDTSVFDSANTMNMEMIGSNSSGNRTCTFSSGSIIPSENNKWQQFHVSGTMPAGTVQVQLFAWIRQNGTAWFSSPKLERGSNPSPVWTPNPTDRIPVLSEEYYLSSSDTELKGGSWSATKQPWAANSYYWTRIKKLYGDGTIEYTTPICATGTPGKDALRLDLTNEMAGVACNASGTPVSGALASVTSTAEVYKGGAKDSGWKFKKSDSGCSSNINESSGAITLNSISSDTATVTVTATKDGYDDLTATMSIHKVKPGANGQPATVFQVEPNVNVIKRDMAGTPHPTTLTVTKYRTIGAAEREATTEKFLHAIQKNAAGNTVSSVVNAAATTTINIVPDAVEVVLELRPVESTASNVPVLDRETVPVITDVADMEVATRNLLLASGDWNLPDGAFSSNPLQGDWWWDDLSMSGSNGNLKMTCNATSGNRAAYERLSIRKAAKYTTMTLRVKGTVSGRTSGHIYFQLVSNWASWQTVGQVAANGEFDLIKTFKLSDEWNGDTVLIYGFGNANAKVSLELEHAGLYIGNVNPTQWTAAPEDGSYLLKAIQRARQDSTEIDGGVILAALLRLGITGSDGVRKIMAGLNGNGESRDALAAFFGGDLIDAALEPNNENRARAAIRHDGTAYFCDNVVRMLENSIELGDSIKFDTAGMKLIGPDKRVRMSITNEMLSDTDVASAASYVTSWNGSFSAQSIRIGSRSQVTRPNGMIQQGATGITHGATWTYSLGSRTANSVLNGTVSLSLGINMNNIPESEPWIGGGLKVEIFYTANSKEYVVFSGSSTFYTDPTTGKGTVQINATLPVSTTYTLRVIATESTGIIAVGTAHSITPTASGQVIRGASDMIKHASNGIVAILGNMRFLMRENYFGVQVSAGFGAQFTPNGIFLKLGSTSWQLLTKASDGTLKLT